MTYLKWAAPILALGLVSAPASAEVAPQVTQQEEASIPFVSHGAIRNWRVGDDETLYLQDRSRKWYKATLMYEPHALHFARAIGLDTGSLNRLDKFSAVIVEGQRIPLRSLVEVDGPPSRKDHSA